MLKTRHSGFVSCVLTETHFTQKGQNSFHQGQNSFHQWQNSFHQLQNSCFETKKYRIFISFASFAFKSDTNSFKIPKKWTYFPILLGIFDEKVNIFVKIDQIGLAKAKNSFHKVPKLISQMPKTHFFGILREWTGLDFAQKKAWTVPFWDWNRNKICVQKWEKEGRFIVNVIGPTLVRNKDCLSNLLNWTCKILGQNLTGSFTAFWRLMHHYMLVEVHA